MSDQLDPGVVLGDYEIVSAAGLGGMGIVYKATQRSLGRVVALKVIREEIARTPEYRDRFLREARLAASVDHPNVVRVYDVGDQDDQLFLAMQWVDGKDLKEVLARSGRLPPERSVAIALQIAGALEAVHSVSGLIHRDVKPGNVLLGEVAGRDHAYLTDFGVARPAASGDQLTQTGWVVGTSGYLAPEQIRGRELDQRSDLYALGCLFFETLTGQAPFEADNEMALRWAHANDPRPSASAVLPALGSRYDAFVAKSLAIDPDERFASGRAFSDALTAAHAGLAEPIVTKPSHAETAMGPPTPMPPPPMHTPQPPPPAAVAPTYVYATPTPVPVQQGRSGNPAALIALSLVALAGIAAGGLAAAGAFSHSDAKTISTVSQQTAPSGQASNPHAVGTTSCGGDLSAGPDTSCPFAKNVERAYAQSSGGDNEVSAYSPVTGVTYTMKCTGGSPHVCTGGKGATVYFTSGPQGQSTQAAQSAPLESTPSAAKASVRPVPSSGLKSCDQNVSVNSETSCPFAENNLAVYAHRYKEGGALSEVTVPVYSPTTHRSYAMRCTTNGATVNCLGGKSAFVSFPLRAAESYSG